jgi:hypothetical protein
LASIFSISWSSFDSMMLAVEGLDGMKVGLGEVGERRGEVPG